MLLWFGNWPDGWGLVVHGVEPGEGSCAAAIDPFGGGYGGLGAYPYGGY